MASSDVKLTLAEEQSIYLDQWMNGVSRSFAVVVSFLEEPLKTYVSIAYLICRIVDNIEDSHKPFAWKKERFAEFSRLMENPYQAAQVQLIWKKIDWPGLTTNETRMMNSKEGFRLWQLFAQLPDEPREIIRAWTLEMAEGMLLIENREQNQWIVDRGPVRVIRDEAGYDRYCFYVAGTVGHLVTRLVVDYYQMDGFVAGRLMDQCEPCGRALQKTNIVKDFVKDLKRGVCYLPDEWLREVSYEPLSLKGASLAWKRKVLSNVLDELRAATDYVLALPTYVAGYRMASLLCLLPAYQTIYLAAQLQDKLFSNDHNIKISRHTLSECIQDAQRMLVDNEGIFQYSQQIEQAVLAHL